MAKQSLSTTPVKSVGKIVSLTIGARGNLIFAAAPTDVPTIWPSIATAKGGESPDHTR